MTRLIFLHFGLSLKGGVERALVNLLRTLPPERYDITLQLVENGGYFFELLPPHIHILPPLWQYGAYSEERMARLRQCGMERAVEVRERVRKRNLERLALGAPDEELHLENWRELREICGLIPGEYDAAIAFLDSLPLKLCCEKVVAKRKIAWVHADYHYYLVPAEHQREFFAKMDNVVCVTPQNAEAFREVFPELAGKTICLPNISPAGEILEQAAEFVPDEYRADEFNVFTAARLCEQKAIDWIVEAAADLKARGLAFRWYIAGPDGDIPARELSKAANVEDVVIFLGPLDNPYPYMKHCDLYAQPSRYEGKPVAVTEAMLLGCTVLLTRYSSAAESVMDGVDGMLCEMNPSAIADALWRLAHDRALRERLAAGISITDDTVAFLEQYERLFDDDL